ncbi:MAG: HAD family hydrolase, partial [Thermoanaerobaculia bacterium]
MYLAIFDLDGTLADTLGVDHRCFIEAFRLEHGIRFAAADWATYRHTTDSGITPEVLERHLARPPTEVEVAGHKRRFIEL